LLLQRQNHTGKDKLIVLFNFSDEEVSVRLAHEGSWNLLLDSKQAQWQENPQQDRLPRNTIICGETFLLLPVSVMVYETAPGS
jgi:pullulanase/glycogen debranching enzyme